MNMGEKIYQLRVKRNLSQDDFAEALGVSRQSVSKWENDLSVPELDKLVKISDFFGITLDELIRGEMTPKDAPAPDTARQNAPDAELQEASVGKQAKWTKYQITGVIFLCLGAWLCLWLLFSGGGLYAGLMFPMPFFLCGVVFLKARSHRALWCAWAWYVPVHVYLAFATGITWSIIFQTFIFRPEWNYTRLVTGWAEVLVYILLLIPTVLTIRKRDVSLAGRNRWYSVGLWLFVLAEPLLETALFRVFSDNGSGLLYPRYQYPFRFLSACLSGLHAVALAAALGLTLAAWSCRRKERLKTAQK